MADELEVTFDIGEDVDFDCEFKIDATTFDYEALDKKPQINGETLIGNKTSEELHLGSKEDIEQLEQNIQNEATTRAENDTLLQNNINTLDEKVDGINVNLTAQIDNLEQDVNTKYNELINDIDEEIQAREQADTNINNRIDGIVERFDDDIENLSTNKADKSQLDDYMPITTKYGASISLSIDNKTFVITAQLKDKDGNNLGNAQKIDLPLESVVVSGSYDKTTKEVVLTLKDGSTVKFSVADLVSGLQTEITDLDTIRSNAQAGKSASDTITTYGNIVTHNVNEFQQAGDYATKNEVNAKQNITDNNFITTAKTVVGAVNELDAKIKDIQLFKFPDATIIGTPVINNGQVSGFSSNNYLILPFAFDTKDRAFEINMAFTTGSNVSTTQNLLGGNYCLALLIEGSKLVFRASNNGTSWNVADITTTLTLQPSTNYFVRIYFDKLSYKISYSTNGEDYTQVGYKVTTETPRHGQVFIGVGNNQFNPFLGIINLNKCNIKLNTSIIWQGMDDAGLATRADISLSNLDELGKSKLGTQVIIRSW